MENTEKNEQNKKSFKLAIIHSLVVPIILFITMVFIDKSQSLASVATWYFFASFIYATTKTKQLTAYYYFKLLRMIGKIALAILIIAILLILA